MLVHEHCRTTKPVRLFTLRSYAPPLGSEMCFVPHTICFLFPHWHSNFGRRKETVSAIKQANRKTDRLEKQDRLCWMPIGRCSLFEILSSMLFDKENPKYTSDLFVVCFVGLLADLNMKSLLNIIVYHHHERSFLKSTRPKPVPCLRSIR